MLRLFRREPIRDIRGTAMHHRLIHHHLKSIVSAGALVAPLIAVISATPAYAAACSSPVKYASSSNTIYLVTPQSFTLSDIKRYCAAAPLTLVDPASKTWELSADLVIQNGASLVLHGDNAQAGPGDVGTLRLRSLQDNLPTDVQNITAKWGTIDADSMTLTSWDDATAAPDTNPNLPSGSASTAQGRAFIRAISYLDPDGSSRQSAMNIVNSTFTHLGYYAGESYGVSYKAEGCDHAHLDVCARLFVTGRQTGSKFLRNFMGTYTWGANNMSFTNNEYGNNVMYGLDPHDVSRNLDIQSNHFHDNGDHGVICSQKCDNLTIEHNESDHNGMVPFKGPNGDSMTDGQVHGIMIHRGVTNTTIAFNYVHDQPTGAGIAVFDSANNSIHDNTVDGTMYGLRLSVGAAGNRFVNNTVTRSAQYAVFMYKGTDNPENTAPSGHPTGNVFTGNAFDITGSNLVKTTEADRSVFTDNTFANSGGSVLLQLSAGTAFHGNTFAATQLFNLKGSTSEPSSVTFGDLSTPIKLSLDAYSKGDFVDAAGQLFTASNASVKTTIAASGSDLTLTSALVGSSAVQVAAQPFTVVPSTGTATASGSTVSGVPHITVAGVVAGQSLMMTAGNLTPLGTYLVRRAGTLLGVVTADSSGVVSFSDAPGAVTSVEYTVAKS
jgi:poly(beta-D-mannuronate) C5 epimerase